KSLFSLTSHGRNFWGITDILLDTAPEGVAEQVTGLVTSIAGVARIDRIRVRPAGKTILSI
ncbi:MAG: hypothetical protein ABTQ93_16065, partial [Candidatus Competibacter denitrificans]